MLKVFFYYQQTLKKTALKAVPGNCMNGGKVCRCKQERGGYLENTKYSEYG